MPEWPQGTLTPRLRMRWAVLSALVTVFAFGISCSDSRSGGALAVEESDLEAPHSTPSLAEAVYDSAEIIVRLAPGVTIEELYDAYDTDVLAAAGDGRTFLVHCPYGRMAADLIPEMRLGTLVEAAEVNPVVEYPEAERTETSMTFADGDSGKAAYADQNVFGRIRSRAAWQFGRGDGVTVAILDTGVDATHPRLSGRIHPGAADLVDGDDTPEDAPDGIDSDADGDVDEAVGHGTFVAGLVLSVAPAATILPIRVLDSDGIGTVFDVLRGIELAKDKGARVVNMSLGMAGFSAILRDALEAAAGGTILVASAGNGASVEPRQPARSQYVIGVAATDSLDQKADFSNFGGWVDMSAPGVGLVSLFPDRSFATWSGTSFAAALVSGAAAVLASDDLGDIGSQRLETFLLEEAEPLDPVFGRLLGTGRLDVLAAARRADDE